MCCTGAGSSVSSLASAAANWPTTFAAALGWRQRHSTSAAFYAAAAEQAPPQNRQPAVQHCVGLSSPTTLHSWQPDTSSELNMNRLSGSPTFSRQPTWMAAGQQLPNRTCQARAQDGAAALTAAVRQRPRVRRRTSCCSLLAHLLQLGVIVEAAASGRKGLKGTAGCKQGSSSHARSMARSREASLLTTWHGPAAGRPSSQASGGSSGWSAVQPGKRRQQRLVGRPARQAAAALQHHKLQLCATSNPISINNHTATHRPALAYHSELLQPPPHWFASSGAAGAGRGERPPKPLLVLRHPEGRPAAAGCL